MKHLALLSRLCPLLSPCKRYSPNSQLLSRSRFIQTLHTLPASSISPKCTVKFLGPARTMREPVGNHKSDLEALLAKWLRGREGGRDANLHKLHHPIKQRAVRSFCVKILRFIGKHNDSLTLQETLNLIFNC